ncbi:hypothetical protein [Nocardia amamiensis]|uniref:hypothetical protein n=1 Tax=Nocardia amamiensis TaxID=404578 RepID=UPI000B011098|nr:hypothetical protein [Nocardia amamiensis]
MSARATGADWDSEVGRWRALTGMAHKAAVYARDPLARTAMANTPGPGDMLPELLYDAALLVVKPEALVTGRMPRIERFLRRRDLTVVAAFTTELDAARSHQLWAYPWVKATTDRMRLHILLSEGLPSWCLLVRREPGSDELPLTMRLAIDKGASASGPRRPGQLRTELGMTNRMISFVHCPDEPADLLRDVYVLGGATGLRLLETTVAQPISEEWSAGEWPGGVDLEPAGLLAGLSAGGRARLLGLLDARREHGRTLSLDEAIGEARAAGARERWHCHGLAAGLIPHDLPGVAAEFDEATVEQLAQRWRRDA